MRSITFVLAALSSLAFAASALAAQPLEQYNPNAVVHVPASTAGTMSISATRPSDVAKVPAPRATVGDEEWDCKLLLATKQACGFYRRFNGTLYEPERWDVYSTQTGKLTGDVPIYAQLVNREPSQVSDRQLRQDAPTWQQTHQPDASCHDVPKDVAYGLVQEVAAGGVEFCSHEAPEQTARANKQLNIAAGLGALNAVANLVSAARGYGYYGSSFSGGYAFDRSNICTNNCRLDLPGDVNIPGGLQRR